MCPCSRGVIRGTEWAPLAAFPTSLCAHFARFCTSYHFLRICPFGCVDAALIQRIRSLLQLTCGQMRLLPHPATLTRMRSLACTRTHIHVHPLTLTHSHPCTPLRSTHIHPHPPTSIHIHSHPLPSTPIHCQRPLSAPLLRKNAVEILGPRRPTKHTLRAPMTTQVAQDRPEAGNAEAMDVPRVVQRKKSCRRKVLLWHAATIQCPPKDVF